MARVLGIGGVFFKCEDPERLSAWYGEHLGIDLMDFGGAAFRPAGLPAGSYTVWGPFPADTDYFAPSGREFMINLIVDDVEGVLERVVAGGGERSGEIEEYEYGRFGWFVDPEGNKVEVWTPRPT